MKRPGPARIKALLFLSSLAGLLACDAEPRPKTSPRVADSQSLYGDPALVPTPEGEHARRELALAGDLRALLPFEDAQVVVRLPEEGPPRVLVQAALAEGLDESSARQTAQRAASSVVGPDAQVELLARPRADAPSQRPATDPLLWLALIAFGVSAGVAVDRRRRA